MNILIVEDLQESKKIFGIFLKKHNCNYCDSGNTLYENLSKQEFDLIIMDIGLPGAKNGIELIKELKSSKSYSTIPIICISVQMIGEDEAMNAGAESFLLKPFTKSQLISAVEKFNTKNVNENLC